MLSFYRLLIILLFIGGLNVVQAQPLNEAKQAFQRGHYEQAFSDWQTVLSTSNNTSPRLDAMLGMARVYRHLGIYAAAIKLIETALPVAEQAGETVYHVLLLNELSKLSLSQGDKWRKQAIQQAETALSQARQANHSVVLAEALNHWGNLLIVEYDYEGAIEAYSEALTLLDSYQPPSSTALFSTEDVAALSSKMLVNQAQAIVRLEAEDAPESGAKIEAFQNSLAALEKAKQAANSWPNSLKKAFGLITIAQQAQQIQAQLASPSARLTRLAYQVLIEARSLAFQLDHAAAKAYSSGYLGHLYEQAKRYDEALPLTNQALFFTGQSREQAFMRYFWQWQLGRIKKAQHDRKGAIAAYQQAMNHLQRVRLQVATTGYFIMDKSFREKISPIYFELADLLLLEARSTSVPEQRQKLLKQAREVIEFFKEAELQDYFQSECVDVTTECTDLKKIIDAKTAVLYPIPLPNRLELLLQLSDGLVQATVPISEKRLRDQVASLLSPLRSHPNPDDLARSRSQRNVAGIRADEADEEVCTPSLRGGIPQPSTAPAQAFLEPSQTLYSWLIKPLLPHLHGIETLVVVPDGALRTFPFAALHDGQQFLITQYALAVAPGLCFSEAQVAQQVEKTILFGGLSKSVQGFSSLPCTKFELENLEALYPESHQTLLNQSFTVLNVNDSVKQADYSVVHFASHGQFGANVEDTFVLTYDGKLSMDKLERLINMTTLRDKPVELLTLSACETAVGDDRAALGLAGVALKAGVKSALASLWKVDDEATPAVIIEFYRQLTNPTISKAKALQNAQKLILTDQQYVRYRHPYYWSAFLLIGYWQ